MTTHYHLVVQIPYAGLSAGMRELNGGFSRWANQRFERAGHLFQNRFGGAMIEDEAHLPEACRYVVLNPVRAGLCNSAADWRWSSYRACAGLDLAASFLAVDDLLKHFGNTPERARAAYREFVSLGHVPVSDTGTDV